MAEKTYVVSRTRTLANGTVKTYTETRKYVSKRKNKEDDARYSKFTLTDEQIAEIKYRINDGVTKKRIVSDYACSWGYLNKILTENNVD